jgi:hypothetical protein
MPGTSEEFVDRLVAAHPELETLRRQHLDDNFDEMLPHLWTSDLLRYLITRFESAGASSVGPILATLDSEAGNDAEIDDVLGASFIEMLPYPGEPGEALIDHLGPRLSEMLHQQRPQET